MATVPLARLVGINLQRLRREAGATQKQLAAAVTHRGLPWTVDHISRAERGRWSPDPVQLLLLAAALDGLPGSRGPVTVADLFAAGEPGAEVTVALTDTAAVPAAAIAAILRGGAAGPLLPEGAQEETVRVPVRGRRRGYAAVDRRVAAELGWDAETMLAASRAVWGRSLSEERAARIARISAVRGVELSTSDKAAITAELKDVLARR